MTWHTTVVAGPPTDNFVHAELIYNELAPQLAAHPSGAWTEVYTRAAPLDPVAHIWRCAAPENGLSFDFYVAFSWAELSPPTLCVSLGEGFAGTTMDTLAEVSYPSRSRTISTGGVFGASWNVASGQMPSGYNAVVVGGDSNPMAWVCVGVSRDGFQLTNQKTIDETTPQSVYVGAFDSLIHHPALAEYDRPITIRHNTGANGYDYAGMTRYPYIGDPITGYYALCSPGTWTRALGGYLEVPSTQNDLAGVIASRQYLMQANTNMTTGQLRGLAKYVLVASHFWTPYANDRLMINDREFAWAGLYWYDTTV